MTTDIVAGIVVAVAVGIIAWLANRFRTKIKKYLERRREPQVTPASEFRKAAAARRADPNYRPDEEVLAEAIREYRETGESTVIPTEVLELLLNTSSEPPAIRPPDSDEARP